MVRLLVVGILVISHSHLFLSSHFHISKNISSNCNLSIFPRFPRPKSYQTWILTLTML